jgi:hypothetical protein
MTSGTIWKLGASRRNHGWTFSGLSTRCQLIAIRYWNEPMSSRGSDMCLVKNTRIPEARAISNASPTRATRAGPFLIWRTMPTWTS